MTKRQEQQFIDFGSKVYNYRMNLNLEKKSREYFLADRIENNIISTSDISLKTLTNIENGYTLPNIVTLLHLSAALEIDELQLIQDLINNIRQV